MDTMRLSLRASRGEIVYTIAHAGARTIILPDSRAIPGAEYPAIIVWGASGKSSRTLFRTDAEARQWLAVLCPPTRPSIRQVDYFDCAPSCPSCGGQGCPQDW